MYSSAPSVPSRGLGLGLLAGFFGWIVATALAVAIGVAGMPYELVIIAFAVPVGLSAWIVRPTSWGVPVLFAILSVPGYFVADVLRATVVLADRMHTDFSVVLGSVVRPDRLMNLLRVYAEDGKSVGLWAGAVVLVFLLAMTAVLFGRSRAARALTGGRPAGPPPGYPAPGPYGPGPAPYAPPPAPYGPGAAFPPPPGMAPGPGGPGGPGGNAGYGPPPAYSAPPPAAPGYTPSPVPPAPLPPQNHAPPPPSTGPGPSGTRRLDPDEFDQMLYEQEQERRRARGE